MRVALIALALLLIPMFAPRLLELIALSAFAAAVVAVTAASEGLRRESPPTQAEVGNPRA